MFRFGLASALTISLLLPVAHAAARPAPSARAVCPVQPVPVLAVENFYGNLVQQLGSDCVDVTVILSYPDAEPASPRISDASWDVVATCTRCFSTTS